MDSYLAKRRKEKRGLIMAWILFLFMLALLGFAGESDRKDSSRINDDIKKYSGTNYISYREYHEALNAPRGAR